MKKLLAMMGMTMGLFALAATASAANPATLILRVTPGVTRDVTLSTGAYDFGSVNLGASTVTVTAVGVTNSGNVTSSLALRSTGSVNWSTGTAAGADTFLLRALFSAAQPAPASFLAEDNVVGASTLSTTQATTSVYTSAASGGVDGTSVAPAASRNLWFRLDMPTSSSSSAQQNISVEVLAQ